MHENIELHEVERLFEGSINERPEFSVKVQDDVFRGIYHDGEIKWYQPQPEFSQELLHAVETKVLKVMRGQDVELANDIAENIELKRMFESQAHDHYKFTLNFQGQDFKGIYHKGEINWFHPQPNQKRMTNPN